MADHDQALAESYDESQGHDGGVTNGLGGDQGYHGGLDDGGHGGHDGDALGHPHHDQVKAEDATQDHGQDGGMQRAEDNYEGKLFIGGISWQTTEDGLRYYFEKYGTLVDVALMKDKASGQPRGFGFVTYQDPAVVDTVLRSEHNIDGRTVDVKRAVPRDQAPAPTRGGPGYGTRGSPQTNVPTESKKIFVGGLSPNVDETMFRNYFEKYGQVVDAVVMMDRVTGRSRGFGFITFDNDNAVRDCMRLSHEIDGKIVEVKRAEPRYEGRGSAMGYDRSSGGFDSRSSGYGGSYGAGYGGYAPRGGGYAGAAPGGYPSRGAGGYGSYGGSAGYGGYGGGYAAPPTAGYGGRGGYSGYGGSSAGYGSSAAGGYGGYGATSAGYPSRGGYGGSAAGYGAGAAGGAGASYSAGGYGGGASGGYTPAGAQAGYGSYGAGGGGGGGYAASYGGQSQDSSFNQTGYGGYRGQATAQGRADRSYRPY